MATAPGQVQAAGAAGLAALCAEVDSGRRSPLGDEVCRRMIVASPIFAAHLLLRGPGRKPFCGRFLHGAVHLKFDEIIATKARFAIMAPRGIGKSEVFSFAYPIWQAVRNLLPDGLLLSSTQDNAKKVLEKIREEVETNPLLRWLYPAGQVGKQWNTAQLTFSNGHTVLSRSVGTKVRGRHPGYVIGDDILTDEAKWSDVYRRKIADYWLSVIEPLPTPDGQLGLVGTPMNQGDLLYRDLRETAEYAHFSFPILDAEGRSLWPELYPVAYIQRRKAIMQAHRFSTEMQLEPVSEDTSMLPRSLMMGPPQEQYTFGLGMSAEALAPLGLRYYAGIDLAFAAGPTADYFCICVLGVDAHENRWIVDIVRRRGVPYNEQFSLVNRLGRKYPCQRIYVEANQAQRILGDELIRKTALPIRKFVMTAHKHDLETGFPGLRRLAEAQKWRIPRGDKHSVELTDILLDELSCFTYLKGRVVSVGAHDDTTAALYIANAAAQAGSGFHFGAAGRGNTSRLPGMAGEEAPEAQPAVRPQVAPVAVVPAGQPGPRLAGRFDPSSRQRP